MPEVPSLTDRVHHALRAIDGVFEGASIFSDDDADIAFFVNGRQVADFVDPATFEVRLTRRVISAERARLQAEPRVTLRGGSDWVSIRLTSEADVPLVADLAELAAAAHRPPPGVPPKLPPSGAELARRRRFH